MITINTKVSFKNANWELTGIVKDIRITEREKQNEYLILAEGSLYPEWVNEQQILYTNAQLKAEIKDAIWELKNAKETITVKSVYDKANGKISFNDLPKILEYLESIKDKFLFTYSKGYLELNVMEKIDINQYVSRG